MLRMFVHQLTCSSSNATYGKCFGTYKYVGFLKVKTNSLYIILMVVRQTNKLRVGKEQRTENAK